MVEVSEAVIALIIAGIVSILSLTIKHLAGSRCWTREACCSCEQNNLIDEKPPAPPPSPVISHVPVNESHI